MAGRGRSFGEVARRYDRARPSYPAEMVADLLVGLDAPVLLDIGCGTGKAGCLFRDAGTAVLGVEPDEQMAQVAANHGLEVEVATFEDWDPCGRSFNLAVCGQAWHWLDPARAPSKAASVLVAGGRLGLFWNVGRHDPDLRDAFAEIYGRLAPEIASSSIVLGTLPPERFVDVDALRVSRAFVDVTVTSYVWTAKYSQREWIDQLGTHSDHIALDDDQRGSLYEAVSEAIASHDGVVPVTYDTRVITAIAT